MCRGRKVLSYILSALCWCSSCSQSEYKQGMNNMEFQDWFYNRFLEVIKFEGIAHSPEDAIVPRDIFLLQIVRPDESWNVSALEAIGQIFTPSFGRLYY